MKNPIDVGSDRPCPAGIAIADNPSLNLLESDIKTRIPFVSVIMRILTGPPEVSDENSVISSNSIVSQTPDVLRANKSVTQSNMVIKASICRYIER